LNVEHLHHQHEPMNDHDRYQLLYGPYRSPRCRLGNSMAKAARICGRGSVSASRRCIRSRKLKQRGSCTKFGTAAQRTPVRGAGHRDS
jgi:hypothetical protein